ncbi:hypothetical protein [Leptodesmis sp.]|uniref:hypothetical protein n=1 Tax=Leptodesmis sp. TaxID=3100501 RepID=UPI0040534ABD
MEEWKFLLQKDGDRSWLPLDAPDAEILEGRYRMVARSSQVNTDIGIRICHLATEEDPPKRRIQKRSSRTNGNGLMVVIPFTYLKAGLWEISCFSTDPMSDLMGDTLHHTVCLSVAAPVAEGEPDDWAIPSATDHSDLPTSAKSSSETPVEAIEEASPQPTASPVVEVAQSKGLSMERLLAMTDDQLSHQVVDEAFREFHWESGATTGAIASPESEPLSALPAISDSGDSASAEMEEAVPALNVSTLRLQLERTALTASRGQIFTLAGQIVVDDLAQLETEIPAHWLRTPTSGEDVLSTTTSEIGSSSSLEGVVARELHLCLRDPQSSTILMREQQAFPGGVPPLNFKFSVSLPHTLATFLLLGEVVLYGSQPNQDEALIALQVMPFTVTVDPENLVEELKKVNAALNRAMLEDGSRGAELADLAVQFSLKLRQEKLKSPLDLSFLNLTTFASAPEEHPPVQTVNQPVQAGSSQSAVRPFIPGNTAPAALKQILPPQLYPAPERAIGKKHLELPVFDRSPAGVPAASPPGDASLEDLFSSAVAAPIEEGSVFQGASLQESSQTVALETTTLEQPPLEAAGSLEAADLESPLIASAAQASAANVPQSCPPEARESAVQPGTCPELSRVLPSSPPDEDAASPIRLEFQSLKLQERFLHRLIQLAEDPALTVSLKQSLAHASTGSTVSPETSRVATSSPVFLETGAMAKEIVVEDDLSWRAEVPRSPRRRLNLNSEVPQNQWLALPEDTPVPTPVVEILTDQIIADSPIQLRVKLPDIGPRIAVKLWVSDRQTRTLLDGPRWLMDFSPNGFDQLETNLEITAPQGSLDIRIEAISVEMQTQRESQKIGLERSVIPAGLTNVWDDDLGF